ncbi:threonine synthase [Neolewinella persica]|uniref:threonine synthase n=1 Tax=Neolewinella persica TaxID=70998 RepID=UPI000372A737|nr:threonine synthase [Neolewinella persica]
MLLYQSTLGQAPAVDFETAVLAGLAPNGGLYVPTQLPQVTLQQLEAWKGLSYPDLAHEILSLFIDEATVPAADLKKLIEASFSTFSHPEVIPHHELTGDCYVQELFHGPTLSFKDVAMGFVVNLFDYFLRRRGEHRTLMVATSGDTGPAAAHASIGKASISTWLFFPTGLITEEQVRQMTTIMSPNVHPVAVNNCKNGSDDLDGLISASFADAGFRKEMQLSSVNSINWARVMTQMVHYFYGYLRYAERVGAPVNFAVPCGAFGNMCAGSMARRMGLPVGAMIVANNANTSLSVVLGTGTFSKPDIKNTLASAIDISVPMNFWRHLYFSLEGDTDRLRYAWETYESQGSVQFSDKELAAFRKGFLTYTVTDENILKTTRSHWREENYLLDPHGAVAVAAARHYRPQLSGPIVCLATAHPAKFPETIRQAIGDLPAAGKHDSLEAARTAGERKYEFDYATMHRAVPAVMRAVMSDRR